MTANRTCPECQTPLPADAPAGLCPRCLLQRGLGSDTSSTTTGFGPFTPPSVDELRPLFPQLEIIELLGQGGMGAVYKARQPGLDRLVALKLLPPAADAAFAERFTREARTLAKLNHPGIVTVYDFGQAGGFYYFVMEFVEGVNLRQAQQAHKLTPSEALAIVPKICEALQIAHDAGIVHRDIKPENILLDAKGRVKIADFGLAKLLDRPEQSHLTGTHQAMGTMHYMAPEQWEKPLTVDHRADIYSLGVVFYELLTGELPLGRFAAPSQKVQVDVRIDDVVLRTLEKEPDRRYQHASDVKTDVERIGSGPAQVASSTSLSAPIPTRQMELLLDQTDQVRRTTQNLGLLTGAFLLLVGIIVMISTYPSPWSWLGGACLGVAAVAFLTAGSQKQRWETVYKNHRIVFENSVLAAERLFIDDVAVSRGGFGRRMELQGVIPAGEGAGDRIVAWTEAGFTIYRLRLFAAAPDARRVNRPSASEGARQAEMTRRPRFSVYVALPLFVAVVTSWGIAAWRYHDLHHRQGLAHTAAETVAFQSLWYGCIASGALFVGLTLMWRLRRFGAGALAPFQGADFAANPSGARVIGFISGAVCLALVWMAGIYAVTHITDDRSGPQSFLLLWGGVFFIVINAIAAYVMMKPVQVVGAPLQAAAGPRLAAYELAATDPVNFRTRIYRRLVLVGSLLTVAPAVAVAAFRMISTSADPHSKVASSGLLAFGVLGLFAALAVYLAVDFLFFGSGKEFLPRNRMGWAIIVCALGAANVFTPWYVLTTQSGDYWLTGINLLHSGAGVALSGMFLALGLFLFVTPNSSRMRLWQMGFTGVTGIGLLIATVFGINKLRGESLHLMTIELIRVLDYPASGDNQPVYQIHPFVGSYAVAVLAGLLLIIAVIELRRQLSQTQTPPLRQRANEEPAATQSPATATSQLSLTAALIRQVVLPVLFVVAVSAGATVALVKLRPETEYANIAATVGYFVSLFAVPILLWTCLSKRKRASFMSRALITVVSFLLMWGVGFGIEVLGKEMLRNLKASVMQEQLLGQWTWLGETAGTTEFRADGTTENVNADGRVLRGQFHWSVPPWIDIRMPGQPELRIKIVFDGNELSLLDSSGGVRRMKRKDNTTDPAKIAQDFIKASKAQAEAIIGKWIWIDGWDAWTEFRADGTFEERFAKVEDGPHLIGKYVWTEDGQVRLDLQNHVSILHTVEIDGDSLTIVQEDGRRQRMKRSK
jgi:serine/threonine protein kinase